MFTTDELDELGKVADKMAGIIAHSFDKPRGEFTQEDIGLLHVARMYTTIYMRLIYPYEGKQLDRKPEEIIANAS